MKKLTLGLLALLFSTSAMAGPWDMDFTQEDATGGGTYLREISFPPSAANCVIYLNGSTVLPGCLVLGSGLSIDVSGNLNAAGTPGPQGLQGVSGNTILSVSGAPSSGLGNNGDYALDISAQVLYGPKSSGTWPIGVSIKGNTGSTGASGSVGATGPQGPIGLTGATGAQGPVGAMGPQGATGATGSQGPIGLTGATGAQGATGATGATGPAGTTDYNLLINKPTIPSAQVNSDWNASSGIAQILNKPALASVATTGAYSSLTGTPSLATVATSGSYNDLSNKPTIPTVTQFNFGSPNSRTLSIATAYQATDSTKAAIVTVSPQCTASITLTTGATCTVQARISSSSSLTCSTGTTVAQWTNGNTGALTIGLALNQIIGSPGNINLPIGNYFILCQTSGTGATIPVAVDQSAG